MTWPTMRDAESGVSDVIASGREPLVHPGRGSSAVRLLVVAQTVVLIGSIALALHYRSRLAPARVVFPCPG